MRETQLKQPELKYIEIQYDAVTQGYLQEFCADQGFDLSVRFNGKNQNPDDFDFHSTVWFTTSEHSLENGTLDCNVTVNPTGFALFGPNEDILVMEIESQGLLDIRDYYGSEYNMTDEWPDFKPHITVCYRHTTGLPDFNPQDVITQPLVADRLNIKTQRKY